MSPESASAPDAANVAMPNLKLAAPGHLSLLSPPQELHAFCRLHGWRLAVVGPRGENWTIDNWAACTASRELVRHLRDRADYYLQAEVRGNDNWHAAPAMRMLVTAPRKPDEPAAADPQLAEDLEQAFETLSVTPASVFLPSRATSVRALVASLRAAGTSDDVTIDVAYSIKTNPSDRVLGLARSSGCLVEAISQFEVTRALALGFTADQVVLNGPGKWWPAPLKLPTLRAIFCDSLGELSRTIERSRREPSLTTVLGVRLRAPFPASRFGVATDGPSGGAAVARELRRLSGMPTKLGVHFHMSSATVGIAHWFELCDWVISRAAWLQQTSGVAVRCLDLGGGWHPDDLNSHLLPALPVIAAAAKSALPELERIVLEPGRALSQPTRALLARVVDTRPGSVGQEAVVDACIAEAPECAGYPHPVLVRQRDSSDWSPLVAGPDRIIGRSCMESDILVTGVTLPPTLAIGDVVAFDQVGAYDYSKSFSFGRG